MINGRIHKLIKVTQQGTGRVFELHDCGTGEKYGVSGSYDDNKVTCEKCLKRIINRDKTKRLI